MILVQDAASSAVDQAKQTAADAGASAKDAVGKATAGAASAQAAASAKAGELAGAGAAALDSAKVRRIAARFCASALEC